MFGRALSRVIAETRLELLAGAGGRAEAFQSRPGMLACSPAERPRPDPSVSVSSSFREGRWSELTCVCAHTVRPLM